MTDSLLPLPPGRSFNVSQGSPAQRVAKTATGLRPDTPRPEEKQQPVSEKAEKRTAYPLKLIVDRQMGHPMTTNKPLFNTWLTVSLQRHLFAPSAEEAKKEYKEIRKEVRGLSAEVTKLIKEGDDNGKGVIAKLKDQRPEVSEKALEEFFDALAKAMKENPSGKEF